MHALPFFFSLSKDCGGGSLRLKLVPLHFSDTLSDGASIAHMQRTGSLIIPCLWLGTAICSLSLQGLSLILMVQEMQAVAL